MKIRYAVATFDRGQGMIRSYWKLPLEGVTDSGFVEFLESAGDAGWDMCGVFPSGVVGQKSPIPGSVELKTCEEPTEEITFIFKKV